MAEGNVVALPGHLTGQREVCEDVVKALEHLLEEARSGAVIGVVYTADYFDNLTSYGISGRLGRQALGALTLVKADLVDLLRSN